MFGFNWFVRNGLIGPALSQLGHTLELFTLGSSRTHSNTLQVLQRTTLDSAPHKVSPVDCNAKSKRTPSEPKNKFFYEHFCDLPTNCKIWVMSCCYNNFLTRQLQNECNCLNWSMDEEWRVLECGQPWVTDYAVRPIQHLFVLVR